EFVEVARRILVGNDILDLPFEPRCLRQLMGEIGESLEIASFEGSSNRIRNLSAPSRFRLLVVWPFLWNLEPLVRSIWHLLRRRRFDVRHIRNRLVRRRAIVPDSWLWLLFDARQLRRLTGRLLRGCRRLGRFAGCRRFVPSRKTLQQSPENLRGPP